MSVLITGGNEMLGSALKRIGSDAGFTISSPSKKEMDLENEVVTLRYIEANSLVAETKSVIGQRIDLYLSSEKRKITND